MAEIVYRYLTLEDCDRISEINPKHYIKNAWRLVDNKRVLIEIDYHEMDWPDGYERYRDELEKTIKMKGAAVGAFDEADKMIGFAAIKNEMFGKSAKYTLLDALFISYEYRGKGIGSRLFKACVREARIWGMDKIYICAGSAEDTIAFYRNIGCRDALEINKVLYEQDTRDIQLEYKLHNKN